MNVKHVEVIVEEPSMEAALRILLPRVLGDTTFEIYRHRGKNDLLKKLPSRLKGYKPWLPEDWRILVLLDRDGDDCHELKRRLEKITTDAGLKTKAISTRRYQVVNRLAVEELEAWYFGDWSAVRKAYPRVSETIPNERRFRDPDAINGGTWETFEKILKRHNYFQGGLRKLEAARTVAEHWDPEANTSKSFKALYNALQEMAHRSPMSHEKGLKRRRKRTRRS